MNDAFEPEVTNGTIVPAFSEVYLLMQRHLFTGEVIVVRVFNSREAANRYKVNRESSEDWDGDSYMWIVDRFIFD